MCVFILPELDRTITLILLLTESKFNTSNSSNLWRINTNADKMTMFQVFLFKRLPDLLLLTNYIYVQINQRNTYRRLGPLGYIFITDRQSFYMTALCADPRVLSFRTVCSCTNYGWSLSFKDIHTHSISQTPVLLQHSLNSGTSNNILYNVVILINTQWHYYNNPLSKYTDDYRLGWANCSFAEVSFSHSMWQNT